MKKILCVFGTRPEAIKMAPVLQQLKARPKDFSVKVCVTAQHRDLLDQVLRMFRISADHDLNIMRNSQTLTYITTKTLEKLGSLISEEKPDWLLVQGDTTTSMAASLSAFYHSIRVAHVEAGLRTWNNQQPFPEEVNRRVISVVTNLHFAPTLRSKENLLKENIPEEKIIVTGNTGIDALLEVASMPHPIPGGPLEKLPSEKELLLVTAHRRENFGVPLDNICKALLQLSASRGNKLQIVYPVHRNPNVWNPVHNALKNDSNVSLLPPVDYPTLVQLIKSCKLILTDSGGLQEEAPSLGKPVLVLREVTERPEGVAAGCAKIVGTNTEKIIQEVCQLLDDPKAYERMTKIKNPYGDGKASLKIAEALASQ